MVFRGISIDFKRSLISFSFLHAQWFKFMGAKLSERDIQKRLDECSRHRRDVRDLPSTPEGFWVPYFEDTQPSPAAKMAAAPTKVDFRLRNRQQVLDESMNY